MTTSADNTPHVVVRNVSHAFRRGRPPVLSGIDLTVAHGEAVAVVGRSGCGKSTLLHILAGLLHPAGGSVHVGGHRVTGPSARWNVMFQKPSLFPWMSAAENVALGLRYAGVGRRAARERAEALLALVHLEGHADDNVQLLSGGQQQRVALARSLATEPELLLLDEPFSALDAFTRAALQDEVRAIARRLGLTLVIVTHDLDEAVLMADRAVVMAPRPGRVTADVRIALPAERRREDPAFRACRDALLAPFEAAGAAESVPDTPLPRRFGALFGLAAPSA
ncbi:ABC transporter ATP-binding protein [Azospirillum sp.]|uniref:ABC transporter ATP-binding protein n=1 Tax=Azospirillum sp. TaxID=34012 RepID=UPI002D583E6A|nr:ABC transporter ATP-binding protein [Azospirillum sp.]HYD69925.1 ABC transporter ATP-binding protein [Azospirillum sp.]